MITDEEFMEVMEKEFPAEDWDNLPDLDTYADIYTVQGQEWVISYEVRIKGTDELVCRFDSCSGSDAIARLQQQIDVGIRPGLEDKEFYAKITVYPDGEMAKLRKMHFGIDEEYKTIEEAQKVLEEWKLKDSVIAESLNIVKSKPDSAFYKSWCKSRRDEILQKKQGFILNRRNFFQIALEI